MTAEEYRCGNVTALLAPPVHHTIKFPSASGFAGGSLSRVRRCLSAWEESVMRKLLVTGVLLGAVAAVALGSLPARADDCVIVRATADARN